MPPHIVVPPAPRRQLFFARQRNTPGAVESPVHDGPSMAKEIEGILDEDGELRVFEPVELFIESLSRLAARLVFALWYLVLVVAVVLEALPQAQWNAMNFCGPDYSATLQDFKKWDSPCVTVNAGSSGTSVMWTGTDLHSMDNHFRSYQQIAMSLPRPMAVNGEHPKRELDITVTYRGDVEAVTMSLTLTCPSSSSRCNMIRLPIDLAANHALGVDGGATLQLVNPPSSLVEAFLQGSTSAVGIVYQRSGYTIATLIWRYAFLVFTLAHALRFASRLRFTGRLYEQVWVLFLQWTAIWYLNPLHALFLTSIPRSSAIAFVEFHFPTIFLSVTIGFMLSVITSSMSWEGPKKLPPSVTELPDVATPSSMSRTAVGQQQQEQSSSGIAAAGSCVECAAATSLVRLLRHQDNLYEPPFWTKCLVLVYVLGVIALIIAQACSDPYFWSITATSLSETGHAVALSWTVLAVLFAGALMSTILLFYLRRHLGRKLYLESRPQQLACRVFLMVFIATMVFYTIHVLLFLLYYNRGKYQAAATTQLFLQLPSIMVASMFVNIMTMVYMNRTPTSGQVPVPPSDPRWKLMIWPDSWYRWLAMHGGSQYIFATETEENNFYRKQLQFRRRQRLHQQKKEWFRRQSRKSRRDISVVASTGTARPDLEESSIMNMDHHSTFFLPVGSSNPPSRMPSCPPSTVNNGSRRLEMYPSLDGSFSRAALPHLHEALSPLNRRRTDNGSLTLDASALRQPTNDSSELSRFSTFPLREGGSMGSPRGEDLSLTNTQMHMHRFPNFRVTHQRTREPSTLHDSGVISLAASNVSSDSESDSHSLNSSSGNVGEQDSASRMEMGSGDIFYQIFLRVERHLGGAISRVNRSLIHPTARRLSRYENVLFDATFGRFQTSAQYLPFFTLDTAMDCLNLSWEVYSLMPTSWREEEAAQQPGQLHPGKVASSGWGCCLPVSDVDSSHGGGVGDDGSSSCSCDEAEPPRVNGPALSGGVFSTPDAASSYRRPIPRPPALTATRRPLPEEAASVSVDVSEDEEEEPSRMPSGSDVGMSANSLPSSPRTIEVPIDVEKYGYELLFVTEIKGVQVLLARMSAAAAEHVGKAPRLVVAFRGTANMENARYDLRMRRGVWDEMERELRRRGPRERQSQQHTCQRHRRASEHDDTETEEVSAATAGCCSSWKTPALERPSVHAGFLSLWRAMRSRVLRELRKVLEANPNTVYRIFCTGHSLGGALASLCAYSTTLELERRRYPLPEVTAYTYGQPRLGNAAFCSAFDQKVPRLFRVVNESDMVATTGMCGSHHVGIEVDVDRHGNYIVQPTAIEQTLRPTTGQGLTVINHLLTNYGASLECMARRLDCPARFMHPYEL